MPCQIIDVHAHTTNKPLWDLHVKTADISAIERLVKKFGVIKTILMATYFPLKRGGLHNRELLKRIAGNKLFAMCASLNASGNLDQGLEEIAQLAKAKSICGIKLYPGYQNFHPSDKKIFPVYELAQNFGLPVIFHAGDLHECCREILRGDKTLPCGFLTCRLRELELLANPRAMEEAIASFPEITFVVSHLANPFFEELRELIIKYPNVMTDISGQYRSGTKDHEQCWQKTLTEVAKFLALPQGADRIMFATDFPIQSHEDSISFIEAQTITPEQKEKIYHQNARRVYGLNL